MIQKATWLVLSILASGCGGGAGSDETAKNPSSGDCPAGMTKEGGECVAPSNESGPNTGSSSASSSGSGSSSGSASTSGSGSASGSGSGASGTPTEEKTPYDKYEVNVVLTRASNQVKNNCGAATDDTGKATGPWGTAKVTITLGRNGRVHGVSVPDPYNGKPVGTCIEHAFQYVIFPPYAAPADVTVDREVELHPPGK